jgi:hypothetical protein
MRLGKLRVLRSFWKSLGSPSTDRAGADAKSPREISPQDPEANGLSSLDGVAATLLAEISQLSRQAEGLSRQFEALQEGLSRQQIASRVLLRDAATVTAPPIRVAIIMNSPELWVDFGAIVRRMQSDPDFDVCVLVCGEDTLGQGSFDDTKAVQDLLDDKGIDYVRFFSSGALERPGYQRVPRRSILDILQPHVIFRPSLHEWTVPPDLRIPNIFSVRTGYHPNV